MSSPPRAALSFILHPEEARILCVWNRRYNGWGLPGGKVEDGETLEQAQARELHEETGLETVEATAIYTAPTLSSDTGRMVHVFRVLPTTYPLRTPYTHEEGSAVEWKTRDEMLGTSPFASFYVKMFDKLGGYE